MPHPPAATTTAVPPPSSPSRHSRPWLPPPRLPSAAPARARDSSLSRTTNSRCSALLLPERELPQRQFLPRKVLASARPPTDSRLPAEAAARFPRCPAWLQAPASRASPKNPSAPLRRECLPLFPAGEC